MPSRAWVVTFLHLFLRTDKLVSMPSRAWVVTFFPLALPFKVCVSMPSRAWVVTGAPYILCTRPSRFNALSGLSCYDQWFFYFADRWSFNALSGLSCYALCFRAGYRGQVSMPSRAWVVTWGGGSAAPTIASFNALSGLSCYENDPDRTGGPICFNALSGLSCYSKNVQYFKFFMILFMHTCYL